MIRDYFWVPLVALIPIGGWFYCSSSESTGESGPLTSIMSSNESSGSSSLYTYGAAAVVSLIGSLAVWKIFTSDAPTDTVMGKVSNAVRKTVGYKPKKTST